MPTAIQPTSQKEVRQMRKDLKRYEELLDHYRALAVYRDEKQKGKLKTLRSLTDLMGGLEKQSFVTRLILLALSKNLIPNCTIY
ncbi:hypothetical protein KAI54_03855 [Candidatus Gracilibacteria bacterium]|nr:hypothetical protein [Candidatus Gracilibacteria bacterium]